MLKSVSLSPSQSTQSIPKKSVVPTDVRVVDGTSCDPYSTPTSDHSDPKYENQNLYSGFDSETISSDKKAYDALRESDLMDDTMKTKDLDLSVASGEEVKEQQPECSVPEEEIQVTS